MGSKRAFKQIIGYVDQLNRDVGQLAAFLERSMKDEGWVSLPSVGKKMTWGLSSSLDYPEQWRLPYAARFFVPEGAEKCQESAFYLILLETKSAFDFPVVLCGRVKHPELTEGEINSMVFDLDRLRSLCYLKSRWQSFGQDRGWCTAKPVDDAPVESIREFILNLFDVRDAQRAYENIVVPLANTNAVDGLGNVLTVERYVFPQMTLEG